MIVSEIRRRIQISKIAAVVKSLVNNEFILHVPSEFDYRFETM